MAEVFEGIPAVFLRRCNVDIENPSTRHAPGRHADERIGPPVPPAHDDLRIAAGVMKTARGMGPLPVRAGCGDAGEHRDYGDVLESGIARGHHLPAGAPCAMSR